MEGKEGGGGTGKGGESEESGVEGRKGGEREGGAEVTDKISCLSWTEKLSYQLASQRNKQN